MRPTTSCSEPHEIVAPWLTKPLVPHVEGLVASSELPVFAFTATDPMGQPSAPEANAKAMEQLLKDLEELCARRSGGFGGKGF